MPAMHTKTVMMTSRVCWSIVFSLVGGSAYSFAVSLIACIHGGAQILFVPLQCFLTAFDSLSGRLLEIFAAPLHEFGALAGLGSQQLAGFRAEFRGEKNAHGNSESQTKAKI